MTEPASPDDPAPVLPTQEDDQSLVEGAPSDDDDLDAVGSAPKLLARDISQA